MNEEYIEILDDEETTVEVAETYNPLGMLEKKEVKVEGGPIFYVPLRMAVDPDLVTKKDGKIVKVGPYPVVEIDFYAEKQAYQVMMKTWGWVFRVASVKAQGWLKRIKSRAILTCVVWGLADYDPAVVPAWSDVRLLRKGSALAKAGWAIVKEKTQAGVDAVKAKVQKEPE
jgi:hypothetical protein